MTLAMLALPGAVFVYNGEELGLPNVDLPDEALRDPVWERSGHTRRGRDASRVPVPWEGEAPPFGFSDNPDTWLPLPADWAALTVEKQIGRSGVHPRVLSAGDRIAACPKRIRWRDHRMARLPRRHVGFPAQRRVGVRAQRGRRRRCELPDGEVLLASAELVEGKLPPDAAAWLV